MAVILITGGARSGKSRYAEERCVEMNRETAYIACARVTDQDMAERVRRHRAQRPGTWRTIEQYKHFEAINLREMDETVFLLDCVTTMVTNLMLEAPIDYDTCPMEDVDAVEADILREVKALLMHMQATNRTLILVTNEVGLGIVPAYRLGILFRDIAGRVNQYLARQADEVVMMISGIPLRVK